MPFNFKETTVAEVHRAMLAGEVTCRELVEYYLGRIDAYDQKGPCLNAIILVNPKALEEADRLDAALKEKGLTSPMVGRMPTREQAEEGERIELIVSVPMPTMP